MLTDEGQGASMFIQVGYLEVRPSPPSPGPGDWAYETADLGSGTSLSVK